MAVSQEDIDALDRALASGEKQVVLDGQSITYRSVDEIIRARRDLQDRLNAAVAASLGAPVRRKQFGLYVKSQGFHG
ncbi:MAG: hypothetical protein Q8K24_05880 [Hydrogenophaga sp.]|nr:hypothetical protein [Hydrogenophaga sp.]